ncbi:hypothetical protein [Mesorhizobium sp. M1E.F.Ca.ET.041.01.1.1]|uniref:hypothetical protein n=1 Tax=Mesorhizobium sp. M1E.F.Ca.ET.041.01.1.1 TaxID=2496759 RepID=UPI000FC9E308|nr:hypothetical protein [Mesorhizobium sp. M1E.F.Ca.ET.041.01.1.1]RUW21416.1 hypothetical protein EOA38_32145 [Mesorhizobium sp. M1E.F.Ca.ET.041.01.1.1]RWD92514.1 MAG: hypothetical protein EOS38_01400 [Mesorhizobium sp.]
MSNIILPNNIEAAARWLAETPQRDRPKPLLPALREIYRLTAVEAVEAIRESHKLIREARP